MSKFLVVDGTNLVMRSVKAAERGVNLSVTVDGEEVSTAATFLFINTFTKYVRQENPDRIVVCWDGGRSKFRTDIYPDYKGDRLDRIEDEDIRRPFALVAEFLTLSGIHHIEIPGVEADDLVAAYVRTHYEGPFDLVILSGDKDFLQLLGPKVSQIRPGVKPERWGPAEVEAKYGCTPDVLPSVMALTGDASDGIPGIPGFGIKTATKYLSKYFWNLAVLMAANEPKLIGQEEAVKRNYLLVDLRSRHTSIDSQVGFVNEFHDPVTGILYEQLVEWLQTYEMTNILARLQAGTLWKEPVQGRLI